MVGMLPPVQATVEKGNKIIEHELKRSDAKLFNDDGSMRLGGRTSPLHRDSPWKKAWNLIKDGDLWEHFQKAIRAKTPSTII